LTQISNSGRDREIYTNWTRIDFSQGDLDIFVRENWCFEDPLQKNLRKFALIFGSQPVIIIGHHRVSRF